jgi:hypothetical protein
MHDLPRRLARFEAGRIARHENLKVRRLNSKVIPGEILEFLLYRSDQGAIELLVT